MPRWVETHGGTKQPATGPPVESINRFSEYNFIWLFVSPCVSTHRGVRYWPFVLSLADLFWIVPAVLHHVIRLLLPAEQSKSHQHHHRPPPTTPAPPLSFTNLASNMNNFKSGEPNPSQNINCGNVSGSYNNTWTNCDISVTDERRHILEWLSPLAPRLRYRDVRRSHVEGVGDWLLRTEEFIDWNTGGDELVSPLLFCYGDPGVGKTHIRYEPTFSRENGGD